MDSTKPSGGFTVYWRIEHFPCNPHPDLTIESPEFEIKSLNSKWQLEIYHRNGSLRVFIKRSNVVRACLICSVSILTGLGWNMLENYDWTFNLHNCKSTQLLNLEDLTEERWYYLPNGSLTISFHIWSSSFRDFCSQRLIISKMGPDSTLHRPIKIFTDLKPDDFLYFPSSCSTNDVPIVKSKERKQFISQLVQTDAYFDNNEMEDLRKLLKNESSFVTLRIPGEKFTVHRAVLCAKSSVFKAMFELEMRENDSGVIDIFDIDGETMLALINILHCQPAEDLSWETAVNLYYAADKYQIDGLKKECLCVLKKEMSVENICDGLVLADLHQDDDLMSCAQDFFLENSKVILPSRQWKDMLDHTDLVAEMLSKLAEKL